MFSLKKNRLFMLLFLLTGITLAAHPHMFFSNRYTIETEGDLIEGIWVDWIFDVYFTQEILFDFDSDGDGSFGLQETREIHDYAFINLAKYNYFQLIRQGTKRYSVEEISDFSAFIEGDHLVYRFYIALDHLPRGDLFLATYDPTFFCAIDYFPQWQVRFQDSAAPFEFNLVENPETPVFYDPYGAPSKSPIFEEWAPGLETFIPLEVHLAVK